MSMISEIKSWLWIPACFLPLYAILSIVGIGLGLQGLISYYWIIYLIIVPLVIAPVTYRSLVGAGCNLRFQICALVKGMTAGLFFLALAFASDIFMWGTLSGIVGVNLSLIALRIPNLYQIWLISGIIGGIGARVIEVREYSASTDITIAGYEEIS